ncbi:MAG: hypothetical protein ABF308_15735 [Phaeobacter gallaeciensis]
MQKWIIRAALAYLVVVGAYFLFSLAAIKSTAVADLERKLNPATFMFWQDNEIWRNPPLFDAMMADPKGVLSDQDPETLNDVQIWVFLLDGFPQVDGLPLAKSLGLDTEELAGTFRSKVVIMESVSLAGRLHILPIFVQRRKIILLDARDLVTTHERSCLDEILYAAMTSGDFAALLETCKLPDNS